MIAEADDENGTKNDWWHVTKFYDATNELLHHKLLKTFAELFILAACSDGTSKTLPLGRVDTI